MVIDLKLFVRKLNLDLLFDKNSSMTNTIRVSSLFNPPLHPSLNIFERTCEMDFWATNNKRNQQGNHHNISQSEQEFLKLLNDCNIRVMKPDKGGGLVFMDHCVYVKSMNTLLNTDVYMQVIPNEVNSAHKKIKSMRNDLFLEGYIDLDLHQYLTMLAPRTPALFGSPKIHKTINNPPFRPIVDGRGSVTYGCAKYIDHVLKPLGGRGVVKLELNLSASRWAMYSEVPKSVCSEACHPGYRKVVHQGQPVCCFDCIPCSDGEVSNESGICIKCPEDYWSNTEKDFCIAKYVEFLSYEDPLGTSLAAIAVVFSLMPVGVLCIFIKHHDTPVVKANNREVSYFLLISNLLCLLTALIFIGPPKNETCIFRQPAFGLFFSVCVSAVLAKTVTVVIAFKATKPGSQIKNLIGSKISFLIICCCFVFQFILCVVWISVSPPFSETDKNLPEKTVIQCNEGSGFMFYCMLGYLGMLASVSLLIAFLARNLPDSFNETKFITFSMIVFVSVWLTFIPAYISTKGKYMVAVEIFAILSSSIGLLLCIFFPKCYIIVIRPDMNTKGYIVRLQTTVPPL
ncbi:vomeronasal type-2 receptor 26-like [Protopterus annectens]|uniref:vomeronasal type-2 receptor 26-like n=1 Tax=Protopterus annectens TaxID=7888 RepID=UPI001CF9B0E4|nr:vomeronasal type-2 receptor 26-like [Protopterus annectens]